MALININVSLIFKKCKLLCVWLNVCFYCFLVRWLCNMSLEKLRGTLVPQLVCQTISGGTSIVYE